MTIKKYFYLAKGENDSNPWVFYGEEPPKISINGNSTSIHSNCDIVGPFTANPIADSIKDNEIIKIYIRKETKKNK